MREAWKPPPKLTLSEWSDNYRVLSSEDSSEPGRWKTSRAEYLRGIMDAITDEGIPEVICMKASQVGWTQVINNLIGYHIHLDPGPIMMVLPTLELAETWSKKRLSPMLRDSPVLQEKVKDARTRDSGNTLREKDFPGGYLAVVGANAAAGLSSRPIRVVCFDEVDRFPDSAGTEGDPIRIAQKRQQNFWNKKTVKGSSPLEKSTSRINVDWERSDKRLYYCKCIHCEFPQVLKWSNVRWDSEKIDKKNSRHHPKTAAYLCEQCGTLWDDGDRYEAISRGFWKASAPYDGVAGFHISGLMSPWLTLEGIVKEFLDVKDKPEEFKVFVNTVLGEVWEDKGETVDLSNVQNRREVYDGNTLNNRTIAITAGIDVQGDRLEVQFIAWGKDEEAWPFKYEILMGDPSQQHIWKQLDLLLKEKFRTIDGRIFPVSAACVDTGGHHTEQVFSFCSTRRQRRIFPIKGLGGPRPVWPKRSSKTARNQLVFLVGVDTAKETIYGRLKIMPDLDNPDKSIPGFIHFPDLEGFEPEYFEQLNSEERQTRRREGKPYFVWHLPEGKRNEALDTFVYALAARKALPRIVLPEGVAAATPIRAAGEPGVREDRGPAGRQPFIQPRSGGGWAGFLNRGNSGGFLGRR